VDTAKPKLTAQAIGAYGEKVVEAELLRHGWMPANVNKTVPNAEAFDILAHKGRTILKLRVKACGPKTVGFVFPPFEAERVIDDNDFTVLVRMAEEREDDEIFILPTKDLQEDIGVYAKPALARGLKNKRWTLQFADHAKGERPNFGFAQKWAKYRGNWQVLEVDTAG
jgi:hypothetical protein